MPAYDHQKTAEALRVGQAYSNGPMGEIVGLLAGQLIDAEAEMKAANARASKAETDLNRAENERESALQATRKLREGNSGYTDLLTVVKAISVNPKGAKGLCAEVLGKIGEKA